VHLSNFMHNISQRIISNYAIVYNEAICGGIAVGTFSLQSNSLRTSTVALLIVLPRAIDKSRTDHFVENS